MKRSRIVSGVLVVLVLMMAALPMAASAQRQRSLTITEEQINNSFAVTNPVARRWSNVSIDLQPGQAVVNGTLTLRRPTGVNVTTYTVSSVWTPTILNGRLYWTLVSATANGQPASAELTQQINNSIASSWRTYFRSQTTGSLTSIVITDSDMTLTWN